ncbi:PREDICTED: beta-galactosidase-like [Camelina sativa]|uniref:Beta-galactosidase-like n=1 Tax=Camelina sativa TaxID=90675 RepID=A0ABM0TTU8_CAMSA|nr:PREDICTED: beta-galactosidase-like [Camelina sativa]
MEISRYFPRHGFIMLLLVMFLSSVSNLASKINGSFDERGTNSKGSPPRGKEYSFCGLNNPSEDGIIFSPKCDKGYVFSQIKFADYGQPTGSSCETLKRGNCGAPATLRLVKENCLGKERCRIYITDEMFGPTHCKGLVNFVFSAICKKT